MRVALVHNPEAGSGDHVGADLLARLRAAGHDASYASTEAASLSRALDSSPDVVLAAGGDGTVGAVARLMVARTPNVPLAILPIGTANNLARSLGVHGSVDEVVSGLHSQTRRSLDVATARAAWGTVRFVESAGVGLFAAMLRDAEREQRQDDGSSGSPKKRARGARLRRVMDRARARHWRIDADGKDMSGLYLFAATLNIAYVGPGLGLAPSADAGDGRLDLLLVREEDRQALGEYLDALGHDEEATLTIPTRRVNRVTLEWSAVHGHVDDHLWPEPGAPADPGSTGGMTEIDIGSSVPVVMPASLDPGPV